MSTLGLMIVFILLWFLSLFLVLPVRMETQEDANSVTPNTQPSVPANPKLLTRMAWATGVAVFLWAICFIVVEYGVVTIDDLNWLG